MSNILFRLENKTVAYISETLAKCEPNYFKDQHLKKLRHNRRAQRRKDKKFATACGGSMDKVKIN